MTVPPAHPATDAPPIPRPRPGGQEATAAVPTPVPPAAQHPWPEPWRSGPAGRPLTEYWDVGTASWRSRAPLPPPRPAG